MVTGLHGALSDLAANLVMEGRSTVEEAVAIHLLPMVAEAAVGRGTNQTLATHTHAQVKQSWNEEISFLNYDSAKCRSPEARKRP